MNNRRIYPWIVFLPIAAVLFLTSCGNGWNEVNVSAYKKSCLQQMSSLYPQQADSICGCFLEKMTTQMNVQEVNAQRTITFLEECASEAALQFERAMEKRMNEAYQQQGGNTELIADKDTLDGSR